MPEEKIDPEARKEKYTIYLRAPANLLNPDKDPKESVYYKIDTSKWGEPLEPMRTASLAQLALQGTLIANMPPEHMIGGACFFLNAQLIAEPGT